MSKKQAAPLNAGADKLAFKQISLRDKLMSLDRVQKEAVANYFNLYNAAAWIFNEVLDQNAKDYVDEAVIYARELNELDQANLNEGNIDDFIDRANQHPDEFVSDNGPEVVGKFINNLNNGKESL